MGLGFSNIRKEGKFSEGGWKLNVSLLFYYFTLAEGSCQHLFVHSCACLLSLTLLESSFFSASVIL